MKSYKEEDDKTMTDESIDQLHQKMQKLISDVDDIIHHLVRRLEIENYNNETEKLDITSLWSQYEREVLPVRLVFYGFDEVRSQRLSKRAKKIENQNSAEIHKLVREYEAHYGKILLVLFQIQINI